MVFSSYFQNFDRSSGTVKIPGPKGNKSIAYIEDTTVEIVDDDLEFNVMESLESLDANKADSIYDNSDDTTYKPTAKDNSVPSTDGDNAVFSISESDAHSTPTRAIAIIIP